VLLLTGAAVAKSKTTKQPSPASVQSHSGGKHVRHGRHARRKSTNWKKHGQQHIASDRAREIQEALIRQQYLRGPATGNWDESSREAMIRYQHDHGWQSKSVPDARALIELGLGPDHDHLINPESAMTMRPHGNLADKESAAASAELPR
jgi:peptidoglycan hydrolase-like protein with peptidoglycan-binding domain